MDIHLKAGFFVLFFCVACFAEEAPSPGAKLPQTKTFRGEIQGIYERPASIFETKEKKKSDTENKKKKIKVIAVEDKREERKSFILADDVKITDRKGKAVDFSELKVNDIVKVAFVIDEETGNDKALSVQLIRHESRFSKALGMFQIGPPGKK